jgi:TadE-like protein
VRRRRWLGRGSGWVARCGGSLRRSGRDRGSFTAELAAGLPALMLLLFAGLAAVAAVSTQMQCVDAAREGAIAAARGDPGAAAAARIAPPASDVDVVVRADSVTVTVGARVPLLGTRLPAVTVRATAIAAREPEAGGAMP